MRSLKYPELVQLDAEHDSHGTQVEGVEIKGWLEAYRQDHIEYAINSAVRLLKRLGGKYDLELAHKRWLYLANDGEKGYSANAGDPTSPNFKPAKSHNIDLDGRKMAALYLERTYRREIFKRAGFELPAELSKDLDDE